MSALGFGFFLGSLPTISLVRRGFDDGGEGLTGGELSLVAVAGLLGWILLPAVSEWPIDFVIGIAILPSIVWATRYRQINQFNMRLSESREDAARRAAQNKEKSVLAKIDRDNWVKSLENEEWSVVTQARYLNTEGQPNCLVMICKKSLFLQILTYKLDTDLTKSQDLNLHINQVIGLNIARPRVTKYRSKQVPISSIETKTKSPVARGLVGGALLGPVGLVLGAASGLNSEVSTTTQNQTVEEAYETDGDPQLIIGTSLASNPVIKLLFDVPSLADEWLYRIKGAQSRR